MTTATVCRATRQGGPYSQTSQNSPSRTGVSEEALELLSFPDTYASARSGKAYAGYPMADPAAPETWPKRSVGRPPEAVMSDR
jgi:hypothetical protein